MSIPLHTIFLKQFTIGPCTVKLDQEGKLGLGGTVWEASLVLARFFQANPGLLTSAKSVLEVGSGTGLCGIAIAKLFPCRVTVTDQPLYVDLLQHNKSLNLPLDNLSISVLDWRAPQSLGDFDIIIATDVVYDDLLHDPLLNAIEANAGAETVVFICNERRSNADLMFYRRWRDRGWTITMLPESFIDEDYKSEEMRIFKGFKSTKTRTEVA